MDPAAAPHSVRLAGVDIRPDAVVRGALVAALIVIPSAAVLTALDDDSAWAFPALLLVSGGLALGGWVAGRRVLATPAVHGSLAASIVVAVVVLVRVVRRLVSGDGIELAVIGLTALLGMWMGAIGGALAARRRGGQSIVRPE